MTKFRVLSAFLAFAFAACSDGAPTNDSTAEAVRSEFAKRLTAYSGDLQRLELVSGGIRAQWSSRRCEMAEGEVIDLLISIHRGHPSPVTGDIRAQRTCAAETRTFEAAAAQFEQYRSGQINDAAILKNLK